MGQRLVSLQIALIDLPLRSDALAEYMALNSILGGLITQTPGVFPLPQGLPVPVDMPIVQANEPSKGVAINISRSRVDYTQAIKSHSDCNEFLIIANKILEYYNSVTIGRFGLIAQYVLEVANPTKWILKTIIQNKWNDWEELLVRFNKKEKFDGIEINNMVQMQEMLMADGGKQQRVVHVQLDINTPAVYVERLTSKDCKALMKFKMESMINLPVEEIL